MGEAMNDPMLKPYLMAFFFCLALFLVGLWLKLRGK